jgi:O-antigen/teichoic acid export membrane protein
MGVLFGSPYLDATHMLRGICAFNIAATFLVNPPSIGALWAIDRQRTIARFRTAGAALNLLLAFILIPREGAWGAVLATGIATLVSGSIEFELSRRSGANDYPVRAALTAGAAAVASMVPGYAIDPDGALQLLLSGGLGLLAYVGVLALLKPLGRDAVASAAAIDARLARVVAPFAR